MTIDYFSVYGYRFSFRTTDADSRDAILRLYRRFRQSPGARDEVDAVLERSDDGFLWRIGEKSATAPNLKNALWGLEAALCEAIIRSQQRMIAVHAATLYSGSSALMVIGPSHAGKSTLAMALVWRGLKAATDDVALIDPETLNICPIPRCFHLDQNSVELLCEEGVEFPQVWKSLSFLTPNDLDGSPVPRCSAGILIYLVGSHYRSDRPCVKEISQAEMTARLLSETGQGPLSNRDTVGVLHRIASRAKCFMLIPGPLGKTADSVADIVEAYLRRSMRSFAAVG